LLVTEALVDFLCVHSLVNAFLETTKKKEGGFMASPA